MFNRLCINDLFALQRYKNFWTFLLFSLCFKALSSIYLQVGNFSKITLKKQPIYIQAVLDTATNGLGEVVILSKKPANIHMNKA